MLDGDAEPWARYGGAKIRDVVGCFHLVYGRFSSRFKRVTCILGATMAPMGAEPFGYACHPPCTSLEGGGLFFFALNACSPTYLSAFGLTRSPRHPGPLLNRADLATCPLERAPLDVRFPA
eukprot:18174-Prorocentrum_minimum.AAC.1